MRMAVLFGGLALIRCAHAPPPSAAPASTSVSANSVGDWLRLRTRAGSVAQGEATVLIEQDVIGRQTEAGGARHVAFEFKFFAEERVVSVDPASSAEFEARLRGVVAKGSEALDPQALKQVAMRLEAMKIHFRLSPQGEARALRVDDVAPPLDDKTARSIAEALYATPHAPMLPQAPVELHARWQEQVRLPGGLDVEGEMELRCRYDRRENSIATVVCDGELTAHKGSGRAMRQVVEKVHASFDLDVEHGEWISKSIEQSRQIEENLTVPKPMSVGVRQHVTVKWTR